VRLTSGSKKALQQLRHEGEADPRPEPRDGLELHDDEANTVAGLVIHEAQTIPGEGQAFSFYGFRFEVLAKRENRLTRLKVRPL